MKEGEYQPNRYHPTAMNIMIKELRIDYYQFLRVDDGRIGEPLHRVCTAHKHNKEQKTPFTGLEA